MTISEDFYCNEFPTYWVCAGRVGQEGDFFCDFQSNPGGSFNTSIDILDMTGVNVTNMMMIHIESVSLQNVGTYNCTASNVIGGQEMVVTREIRFFVGGK